MSFFFERIHYRSKKITEYENAERFFSRPIFHPHPEKNTLAR